MYKWTEVKIKYERNNCLCCSLYFNIIIFKYYIVVFIGRNHYQLVINYTFNKCEILRRITEMPVELMLIIIVISR